MRLKRLNRHINFTVLHAIRRVRLHKRFHRHAFQSRTTRDQATKRRQLPSVCRNVPEVCRKTLRCAAVGRGMHLKPFNRRRFSLQSDPAILILPQAVRLDLALRPQYIAAPAAGPFFGSPARL
jgi:hypothetical protein